jgi:hypothetical protein
MGEEVLVPYASRTQWTTHLRSSLITTSLQSLRSRRCYDRYLALLDPERRADVVDAVAGLWLPIEIGVAHYDACEALNLSSAESYDIGRDVGDRVQGSLLGVVLRTAKGAGISPWTGLMMCSRLYDRLFLGGSVQLVKLGPKEARLEVINNPCVAIAYWRSGFRGIVASATQLFASKSYVTELPKLTSSWQFAMRISWA